MSCKTEAGAASEPGRAGQGRVVLLPRRPLTSTGLGLRRAGSRGASTPSQARSASASAPWGCESSTMRRGVSCCEKPGSSWLLPPRSMQDATGCEPSWALRRSRIAQPSRASRRRHLAARRLARATLPPRAVTGETAGGGGRSGTGSRRGGDRDRPAAGTAAGSELRRPLGLGAAPPARPLRRAQDRQRASCLPSAELARGTRRDLAHTEGRGAAEVRGFGPGSVRAVPSRSPFHQRYKTASCSGSGADRAPHTIGYVLSWTSQESEIRLISLCLYN